MVETGRTQPIADPFVRLVAQDSARRDQQDLCDEGLEKAMAEAGLGRRARFGRFGARSGSRRLLGRMMAHFGIAPEKAAERQWAALKEAARVCARCARVKRCRSWLDWGLRNDAPRLFCPNAERLDEIARAARGEDA